jgi:hypothetical protein
MHAYDQAGQRKQLGRPLAQILGDLAGDELRDVERFMHARRDVYDADVRGIQFPKEVIDLARAALTEFQANTPRTARLRNVADAITHEVFDASLDAMVVAGRRTPDWAHVIKTENPFYIPAHKVPEHEWFDVGSDPFRPRTGGSYEQRIGLMDALQDRFQMTARILNEQARFNALLNLADKEGVGAPCPLRAVHRHPGRGEPGARLPQGHGRRHAGGQVAPGRPHRRDTPVPGLDAQEPRA